MTAACCGGAAPNPYSESVTILRARNKRLAKLIDKDGKIIAYDKARTFDGQTVNVDNLLRLRALLHILLRKPDRCIVRGALIAGERAHGIRRLLYPDLETGDAATIRDVPRRWLALDEDVPERPEHIAPQDLLGCADDVIDRLPRPFWRAQCLVQATASHGLKPGSRLRLWYWCDRPMSGAELQRWVTNTDQSVLCPNQPIYTAAPVFGHGRSDHLHYRLILWPGEEWLQCPSADELAPLPRKPVPELHSFVSSRAMDAYARAALVHAADAIISAQMGNRHRTLVKEARGLARLVNAGLMAAGDVRAVLTRAAEASGKDDADEIEAAIDWGFDNPSDGVVPEARHAA